MSKIFDSSSLPGGLAVHQQSAIEFTTSRKVALIADPPGAGKTAIACAHIAQCIEGEARHVLWVTEAGLIGQTLHELHRFLPTISAERWMPGCTASVSVVSYDTLARHVDRVLEADIEVLILDEVSAVKNAGARGTAVATVVRQCWSRLALTATPMEIDPLEPARILRLLAAPGFPDEALYDSWLVWGDPWEDARPIGIRHDRLHVLRAAFAPHMLRRDHVQVGLAFPQLREEHKLVQLTEPQQQAYRRALRIGDPRRSAVMADIAASHASGRSAKAEAALRWLLDHPDEPKVVVYAEHLEHLDIMARLLTWAGVGWLRLDGASSREQRRDTVRRFTDDPTVRVLLGSRVLERGIDGLQHARVMLSLGSSYNPGREQQRIGRLVRPGSPHSAVLHLTFVADVGHERAKTQTLQRRRTDNAAVLAGP